MKKLAGIVAALALIASAAIANAQLPALSATFFAAGSSAQYNTFALAGVNVSGLCGTNFWTQKGGAQIKDARNAAILPETGNIWIEWNANAASGAAGGIVCYYVSVDSIVGLRAYFANATVSLVNSAATSDNSVPLLGAGGTGTNVPTLPANIVTYVNNTKFNYGATDIRPEDGKFATMRALTAYGTFMTGRGFTGVGYQGAAATPWLGVPIVSSVSTAQANPVDWAFVSGDKDPVTGVVGTRPYTDIKVGAAPVVVVANVSNTAAGHMGDTTLAITDVTHTVLANVLTANIAHIRDLTTATNNYGSDAPLHVWIREPLSGTYNTMEFNIPDTNNIAGDYAQAAGRVTGQEGGITTTNVACAGHQTASGCTVESGNPLFHFFGPSSTATRGRVIGTGEMVTTVNGVADSIGYAFWGFSTFNGKTNLRYLTVDGSDPINANYTTGALPTCTTAPCILAFTNIKNGGYPIWSIYRGVYDPTDATNISTNMVANAQTASTTVYSDLVPATSLNVFRSHFGQVVTTSGGGFSPNNGIKAGFPETGGDMGGMVLTVQEEQDFNADTGNQLVNLKN